MNTNFPVQRQDLLVLGTVSIAICLQSESDWKMLVAVLPNPVRELMSANPDEGA